MKKFSLLALLLCSCTAFAFQQSAPDSIKFWKHSLVSALTFTQVSYTNWAQGGQNSLAYTVSADGKSEWDVTRMNWANSYKLAFGQARLGDQGIRKTDDKIDLQSVFTYKLGAYVNPFAGATLKTQFAYGRQYDASGGSVIVSKFFDPAYLTQSVGFGYQPIPEIKTRLGAALREVITSQFPSWSDDPKTTAVEKINTDGGAESITEVEWKLEDNVLFTAKVELFAPFNDLEQFVLRGDNTLAVKVGKYITVNLNVQFINDKQVTPRTQVKEALAFGLSYTLL